MFEKLRIIFTIPELRKKILLTLLLLAVYRIGWQIPLPIVDAAKAKLLEGTGGMYDFFKQVSVFSASQLNQATIFGLGIMPYISASIIFQLLASVWGPLEKLQKEGESGRKKINEYTRYVTVIICLGQSWAFVHYSRGNYFSWALTDQFDASSSVLLSYHILCTLIMTCGTIFLMWLGEQIDEYGIGNGISLLIMAGILARMPTEIWTMAEQVLSEGFELGSTASKYGVETMLMLAILFVAVVAGVVFMYQAQRRITTQSAKAVRGRRVYGGTRQYLPLRVNASGVMPIIFASSLLLFPGMIFSYLAQWSSADSWFPWAQLDDAFQRGTSYIYNVMYIALIFFFCYFWTAITFNPKDMAENLKNFGSFIPGYRPGKRTAEYLEKVMVRITYVGAAFLALVAITPTIVSGAMGVDAALASFYGGTGLLIAVSVAFDLVQKIDSHLVMRNYKGLLEG